MSEREVDLFVVGAGSGGVRAARIAAGYGASVMIAEEYRVGGTCVIRGCVPKKFLVYASRFPAEFEDAAGYGWTLDAPKFDWATLIANKDHEIGRLETAYIANLGNSGVEIAKTRAVLEDAGTVHLLASGERVRARHILIATGGTPFSEAVPGMEHVISSNEALDLKELPRRILIQGGGYIAVEFACIFSGLGAHVTLVYRGHRILRGFDEDVRTHIQEEMQARGIDVRCGHTVVSVGETDSGFSVRLSNGEGIAADKVMFATGRRPHTKGLGLERAGVNTDANGAIPVDAFSRTSAPNVYAVGDVTNRVNLTPIAIREGHAFADTVFGGKPTQVDHSQVPTAVFSEPEAGVIGLTEAQARERYAKVHVFRTSFRPMKVTLSGRRTRALMKLVVDGDTDRVLGCHVVAPDASEMVQLAAVAMRMGATKADFDATLAVHPTAAEELVTMRTPSAVYDRTAEAAE